MTSATHFESVLHIYLTSFYRRDLQGIRAASAFLIMIYHIWLGKVSGGVDVFFVVSGFLMGSQLLRTAAKTSTIDPLTFWSRLVLRIFPSAYFVLFSTIVLTVAFIPPPIWKFGVLELIASSAFVENWELVRTATDYLARENPPSQFQQFWALSVQIQFYLVLPLLMFVATRLAEWTKRLSSAVGAIASLAGISLLWSLYATGRNPSGAYFSTFTRAWELLTGVLAAFVYPTIASLRLNVQVAQAAYALAFASLLVLGALVPVSIHFPGWIAAVPVLLILLIILCGSVEGGGGALGKLLSTERFVSLGELSFTIYLWHWPILIAFHHILGTTELTLIEGLTVMALALAASFFTNRFVERPLLAKREQANSRALLVVTTFAAAVFVFGVATQRTLAMVARWQGPPAKSLTPTADTQAQVSIPFATFVTSNYDRPYAINHCLEGPICKFGATDAKRTVALVGESHAAQWQPALEWIANKRGFRLVTVLTNQHTLEEILKIAPEVVVTTSTSTPIYGTKGGAEKVPDAHVELWSELSKHGIKILAIRDNPRFNFYQNACVWNHRKDAQVCGLKRNKIFSDGRPAKSLEGKIPGLRTVDLTDLFCGPEICPAVHDDQLIYYDRHHFTASYMKHIAPAALDMIAAQAPGTLP